MHFKLNHSAFKLSGPCHRLGCKPLIMSMVNWCKPKPTVLVVSLSSLNFLLHKTSPQNVSHRIELNGLIAYLWCTVRALEGRWDYHFNTLTKNNLANYWFTVTIVASWHSYEATRVSWPIFVFFAYWGNSWNSFADQFCRPGQGQGFSTNTSVIHWFIN